MKALIKLGASGVDVRQVQDACNRVGCPCEVDGSFGKETEMSVRCYQHTKGLKVDGVVGPITWGLMHPEDADRESKTRMKASAFAELIVQTAINYIGLRELGKNRGAQIDKWNRELGLSLGSEWCVSAVQGIFAEAANKASIQDPLKPDTGGVLDLWRRVPEEWKHGVMDGIRGDIGIMDWGAGKGHAFIVAAYKGGHYETLEGNTNVQGGRDGNGFWAKRRSYTEPKLLGFIRVPV